MESPSYGPNTEELHGAKKTSTVCNKQLQKHEQDLVHVWDTAMGVTRVRSTSKAEILNQQFQSVYTKENLMKIPNIAHSKIPSMKPHIISTLGVTKLLKHLKPHKAPGPDNSSLQCNSVLSDIFVKNELCIPLEMGSNVLSTGEGFI